MTHPSSSGRARTSLWPPRSGSKNRYTLHHSLVLVGLMGAGKTTVGRRLAKRIGVPFYDMDKVIEESEGLSVSEIFSTRGESYFRAQELATMESLLSAPPAVIATGGGAFAQPIIRDLVQEQGISLWLDAPLEILLDRVSRRNTRPLLETGDKAAILAELLEARRPAYAKATLRIESSDDSHDNVVHRIVKLLQQQGHLS